MNESNINILLKNSFNVIELTHLTERLKIIEVAV